MTVSSDKHLLTMIGLDELATMC